VRGSAPADEAFRRNRAETRDTLDGEANVRDAAGLERGVDEQLL
jgi:hypothetical protein